MLKYLCFLDVTKPESATMIFICAVFFDECTQYGPFAEVMTSSKENRSTQKEFQLDTYVR